METKTVFKGHLVRTEDLVLEHEGPLCLYDASESIDEEGKVIRSVAIASGRQSRNGYSYSDQAFNDLTQLAEGAHVYLDHPSKEELKSRDGVRSVKDFSGLFHNIKREGDKVSGDLYPTESAFPIFKDVSRLSPKGMGMSINSRVKLYKNQETGKEEIVALDKLHSVDFVSSASLTNNLWESLNERTEETAEQEKKDLETRLTQEQQEEFAQEATVQMVKRVAYEHQELNRKIQEGVIADQLKQDEVRKQTSRLIWRACDMVTDVIRDKELKMVDKKNRVSEILDDLDDEIQKAIKQAKSAPKTSPPATIGPPAFEESGTPAVTLDDDGDELTVSIDD